MTNLFDYISLAKNAESLIYRFGDDCNVVTYQETPAPNPIDPPQRLPVSTPTRGVWLRYKESDLDDTNILRGDQMVLLAGRIAVDPTGVIVRNSNDAWQIVAASKLKPGPTSMIWKVQVRQ